MKSLNLKHKGMADVAFILIIVGACSLIGMLTVEATKTPDSPLEQAMEQVIKGTTGQDVDFSVEIKKGKVN